MPPSHLGFAERQHVARGAPARPAPRQPRRPGSAAPVRIGHHTDRDLTRHLAGHISSRRQHPVTADSPEGTSLSRISPEVSCAGEIGAFLARSIVGRRRGPGPGVSPLVLLRFWRTAVTCDTYPSAYAYRHGCRVRAAGAHCRLASRPGRGDSFQKTGLRSRRHHQHHGPFVPDPAERHEPRIQCVLVFRGYAAAACQAARTAVICPGSG